MAVIIDEVPLAQLEAPLAGAGRRGVFGRYLRAAAPQARAIQARVGGERAFVVSGVPTRNFELGFSWIFGRGPALDALLAHLIEIGARLPFAFEPGVAGQVHGALGRGKPSEDLVFIHEGPVPQAEPLQIIESHSMASLPLTDRVRARLPPPQFWERVRFRFSGLVDADGAIPATVDTTVHDARFRVIQAVFTDPDRRRQGLAGRLVRSITAEILGAGQTPIYIVNEANHASCKIARAAGYQEVERIGVLE